MQTLDQLLGQIVSYVWGLPQVVFLIGSGLVLTIYSRFAPYLRLGQAVAILRGKYARGDEPGEITQFQAVSTALASTVGLGNISGVAIAITQGGPGALFWMWVAALVGMGTKFFTCSLAVMYRGRDSLGNVQGGPMYYIEQGLGRRAKPLAIFFSACGLIGCLAMFQANQLAEILSTAYAIPRWTTGLVAMLLTAIVILGGVSRIARVASAMVPAMCLLYLLCAVVMVAINFERVPGLVYQIFHDAFTGTAAVGGAAGISFLVVLQTGVKRAAFSNEAGIGTAPMAHGAARTTEPIREGLVAMIEPVVDTILVCSLTAIVVLSSADWESVAGVEGISLTVSAFETGMGIGGKIALVSIVSSFALSTMFGYSYYGKKCFSYIFGAEFGRIYDYFYLLMIFVSALFTAAVVINLVDIAFGLMAIPNLIAALWLSPKVMAEARRYFADNR